MSETVTIDSAENELRASILERALAGLHAGILGLVWMWVVLFMGALLTRHSMWQAPTLFGTTFYGSDAYGWGFGKATWSGLALMIAIYGAAGVVWGVAWGEKRRPFLTLYGAAAGLGVYVLFFRGIWPHWSPALALYAPTRPLQVGHLLWGAILARSPGYARRLGISLRSEERRAVLLPGDNGESL